MKSRISMLAGMGIALWALVPLPAANAQDVVKLPPLNLGGSNFNDGVAYPGWFFQSTNSLYRANRLRDGGGAKMPGPNNITSASTVLHLVYMSKRTLLGGNVGGDVLLPVVWTEVDLGEALNEQQAGVGDLSFGTFLQWRSILRETSALFVRLSLAATAPTGSYDRDRRVNLGSNIWTLNPYLATTWQPDDRWELSNRITYVWNSRNDPTDQTADETQAGQALSLNFGVSRLVASRLRVGVAGYYLAQTTDDRLAGRLMDDSRERVLGFGLGLTREWGKERITLGAFSESVVRGRPEGNKLVIRYGVAF